MKVLFEKFYTLTVAGTLFLIPIYVLCKILLYARTLSGSNLSILLRCFAMGTLLLAMLYVLRYCIIQVCSRLSPLTIDGDQLVKDYGIKFTKQDKGNFVNYTFDDGTGEDGIVTLIVRKGTTFVENVVSSNSRLDIDLSDIGWNVSNVSSASCGELSYIIHLGDDYLYLSEDQLVDFFSYLMVRQYEDVDSGDMIDEEIEKYCTGLGLVPSA
jgi:hypothetical protein